MLTLCLTLLLQGPQASFVQQVTDWRHCRPVSVPDAFQALAMSRLDPVLVCQDSYSRVTNVLTITCKKL